MRTLTHMMFACVAVALLSAANCTPNADFVNGTDRMYGPVYKDYVELLDKKSGYDADTKRQRKQTADELKGLIDDAKKKLK